jgi:site-specific DNA-methyltransferase (adenine-specific)
VVARKPLVGTVIANVLKHGTGAINIGGCRVALAVGEAPPAPGGKPTSKAIHVGAEPDAGNNEDRVGFTPGDHSAGRWPPNTLLAHGPNCNADGCEPGCPVAAFDAQTGGKGSRCFPTFDWQAEQNDPVLNEIAASGFMRYAAKTSRKEREAGCEAMPEMASSSMSGRRNADDMSESKTDNDVTERFTTKRCNHHPTVKPLSLMRWLVRLVTPSGGVVLDPFLGSGTTAIAALLEGFSAVGVEREAQYVEIARARITHWAAQRRRVNDRVDAAGSTGYVNRAHDSEDGAVDGDSDVTP